VDVVERGRVPGDLLSVGAGLGVGADNVVDQAADLLAVLAAGAGPLGERLKVAGQMTEACLAAGGVDEVIDAVAVADQQAIE
jgi:hypothetical protein